MKRCFALVSLSIVSWALAGCEVLWPAETPDSAVHGDVPLLIVNESSAGVCRVRVLKREGHQRWSLLEPNGREYHQKVTEKIAAGQSREFRVAAAPGMVFGLETCESYSVKGGIDHLDTTRPTLVRVIEEAKPTTTPMATPAGYTEVIVPVTFLGSATGRAAAPKCLPDGAGRPENTMDFCCHKEYRRGAGQQSAYCGP